MKRLHLLFLSACIAVILSCSMARLDKYPGVKQDEIPVVFQGSYYLKMKQASKDPEDSIWIGVSKDHWVYQQHKKYVSYKLSEDVVFSKVGKYYVMSTHDDHIKKFWNSWVVVSHKKDLELYPIISIQQPHTDKLSKYLNNKFDGVINGDSVFYYETNDDAFIKYFEKEIKGSKTFRIVRIKDKKQ